MARDRHAPYEPCPCGSGKKYKFCCRERDRKMARLGPPNGGWAQENDPRSDHNTLVFEGMDKSEKLNNEGMRLLESGKFKQAKTRFKRAIEGFPLNPAGHNNLAMAIFLEGDLDEAIRQQIAAVEELPVENPFGMSQLAHFYWVAGREDDAHEAVDRALKTPIQSPFSITHICQSLIRLRRYRETLSTVLGFDGETEPLAWWYAGVAAANLGDFDAALRYLQSCKNDPLVAGRANAMINRIRSGKGPGTVEGNWTAFLAYEIMPRSLLRCLDKKNPSPEEFRLVNSANTVDFAVAFTNEKREDAQAGLQLLENIQHPRADEVLEKIACGTFGSDDLRLSAAQALIRRGVWERGRTQTIWLQGKWQEITTGGTQITTEKTPSAHDIPPPLLQRLRQAIKYMEKNRFKKAEKELREMLKELPDHPVLLFNLSSALRQQDKPDEAKSCLVQASKIEPEYLLPPCHLAILHVEEGETEKAREVLEAITIPEDVHPSAMVAYFMANIYVALAEKDVEKARAWLNQGKEIFPDDRQLARMEEKLKFQELLSKPFPGHR